MAFYAPNICLHSSSGYHRGCSHVQERRGCRLNKLVLNEKSLRMNKSGHQAKYLTLSELRNCLKGLENEEFILTVPLKMEEDDNANNTGY